MKTAILFSLALPLVGCALDSDDQTSNTDDTEQAASVEINHWIHLMPVHSEAGGGGAAGGNLSNHGGSTITNAKVVTIYWGSAWNASGAAGVDLKTSLNSFVKKFGTTGQYNTITQYSGIQLTSLFKDTTNDASIANTWTDSNDPPSANVTDAMIQGEVTNYLSQPGVTYDPSAIYEVFLPNGFYSSDGTSTSCGGPKLAYCAYHSHYTSPAGKARYASMPYPSCGGCGTSGFNDAQNFEHFISHETREAVTDADGTAWYDKRGYEADDKCAWSPTPKADSGTGTNVDGTGFAYQYEWSNANSACVFTR
jgi:hypothetical protein